MSLNLPNHFVTQFATNIEMLLQQKMSRLRDKVTVGSYRGESGSPVDQIGAVEMQPAGAKFAPMGRVDAEVDRRWVYPSDYELPQLIHSFDKLKMITDPGSMYVQNAHQGANRKIDDLIITAIFGEAKTGKSGSTATAFDTNNTVPVAASGLTMAKLIDAKEILMANEVDLDYDELTIILSAKQHTDLLNDSKIVSLDYQDKPVLKDGRITSVLGFNVVHSERLPVDGSSYRRVPFFAKSGMHLGIWEDKTVSVSKRNDLSGEPWQAYLKMSMGATRLQEGKIGEILCSEA